MLGSLSDAHKEAGCFGELGVGFTGVGSGLYSKVVAIRVVGWGVVILCSRMWWQGCSRKWVWAQGSGGLL